MRLEITLFALAASGCRYDEGIVIKDMHGKVVIPAAAATRILATPEGDAEVTDVRLIGPVYLGLFPAVVEGTETYPAPFRGPVFQSGVPGNTYPYGGTSVGDMRFPCMESLKCKLVSGRYVDFDGMVDWFSNYIGSPIVDANGAPVTTGSYLEQTCLEVLDYVTPEEIRLTANDENEDGAIDVKDLEFVQQDDGSFVADFTFFQQEWFASEEGDRGFTLWGWMDAPSGTSFSYSTCNGQSGFQLVEYNRQFFGGTPYPDLLNLPTQYISDGDWVSSQPYVYTSPDDEPTLVIDFPVGG